MARADDDTWDPADDREELAMLGLIDILAAHTRFLDEYLAAACRAGIRQVVLLASGMDTRPYRLWWPRGTTVYEIDRPQLLDFKSEVLRGLGATLTANRCAVGIDLRQDWLAALHRVGFDPAQPTVWIAEQLLVGYLPPAARNRLLHDVTAVSAAGKPIRRRPPAHRYVPEYLASRGWATAERNIVELLTAMGLAELRRGGPQGPGDHPALSHGGAGLGMRRRQRR
jgi:methyltransferase (TIGR00027 family)